MCDMTKIFNSETNMKNDLLTIVILTYNEEKNIKKCLKSCFDFADRIIIVDNYSTDNTLNIAKQYNVDIYQDRRMVRDRIRWVLEENIIHTKWVLFLDADERLTKTSGDELLSICEKYKDNNDVNGIVVRYRLNFMGRDLCHGGFYPLKKLRAFKPGTSYYETAEVDEHFVLRTGKMVYMKNDFLHLDYKGLKHWVDKHTIYAQRAAMDFMNKKMGMERVTYDGLELTAKIKRFLKYNIYYKLPSGFRAWLFYIYCYYIRLGFLDGREGKIYAFLHSYWYRFLVDSFIYSKEFATQGDETI